MSINNLFSNNDYQLKCYSLQTNSGQIVGGNLTVDGNLEVDGTTLLKGQTTVDNNIICTGASITVQADNQGFIVVQSQNGQSAFLFLGDGLGNWRLNTFGPTADLQLRQVGNTVNRNFQVQMGTGLMQLTSGGITFNGSDALNDYREQNVTLSYSGPFAAPQTATARFTKVGKLITATFTSISAAATVAGQTITSTAIPSNFFPLETITQINTTQNNSSSAQGIAQLNSSGILNISVSFGGNFTAAGNAGFNTFSISYSIA